jgi:lipoprotein-anchoring transpeptidase ErfK/SrfK
MSAANVRSIRATVLAALAVCIVPAGTAHARLLFWPQWGYWSGDHAPPRHSQRHRHAEPKSAKKDQAQDVPNGPLQIIISIVDQRISVYDNGALIARSSVSTGIPRHPTPLGVFSVISKQRWHRSNLYSAAPMPYMQRITWSGIALHAGVLPGYPASHGCIRLKNDFAIRLWHLTKRGTRVVIASDDIRPVEIADPRLFASRPKAASGPLEFRAAIADNAALTTPAVHPASTSNADTQQATDLQAPGSMQAAVVPRKVSPISVFVSRKSSQLFVRQGFTPLFDIPVKIQDPEQLLGTHVFTVTRSQEEGETLRWTVVSMPEKSLPTPSKRGARSDQIVQTTPPVSSPDKANAALDRLEIPQDVVERISQLLTPGSSLIISDYGISGETGKGTDFIVVTQ